MTSGKLDFVGFGALNMDIFCLLHPGRTVDQIAPGLRPGGEIMGDGTKRKQILEAAQEHGTFTGRSGGGQAANTAVALARMGFQCGYLGKVGDDEMGGLLLESLEDMDKSHIQRGGDSGMCLCILDQNGERANVVFPGSNDTVSLDDSHADYVRASKALHITSFCSERILELQEWLLGQNPGDAMITLDPGEIYSRLGVNRLRNVLKHTRILFATVEELEMMTGKGAREAAADVIECGTEIVVCKKGDQGSEIITKEDVISVAAVRVEQVVDKTGAGDVYAAGFIAGLLMEQSLETCGKLGSEAAALSISAYGREKYPGNAFLRNRGTK